MNPVASAVVRTYNSARTVEATLASLRAQDVPVEILVVDSGSTDGTLELVAGTADRVLEEFDPALNARRLLDLWALPGVHVPAPTGSTPSQPVSDIEESIA